MKLTSTVDRAKERRRRYREAHPDRVKESVKKYTKKNSEKIREYKKKWTLENKDKTLEYSKRYRTKRINNNVINKEGKERAKELNKKWRSENKDRVKEFARNYILRNPDRNLYSIAKHRAKRKNIPFNLSPSDIIIPDFCPLIGIPLERGRGKPTDHSPSIDRIIPNLGYVKGNVIVISCRANRIKQNASVDEIELLANNLRKLIPKPVLT